MSTMEFNVRPKEAIAKDREERAKNGIKMTEVSPQQAITKIDVNKKGTVFVYKPTHGRQIIRNYTSYEFFKENLKDITVDQFIDECIKDATLRGIINFVHVTPEHNHVYIGIEAINAHK